MIKLIADYFRCPSGNPSFISRVWSHCPAAKADDVKRLFLPAGQAPTSARDPVIQQQQLQQQQTPHTHPSIHTATIRTHIIVATRLCRYLPPPPPTSQWKQMFRQGILSRSYCKTLFCIYFFLAQTAKGRHQRGVLNVSESDAGVRATHSFIIAFNLTLIDFSPAATHPVQHPQSQPMASPTAGGRLHPWFKFQNKSS